MHRSRINGLLIDCKIEDIDAAARFWAEALGRPVDPNHPGSRGNYRMLETPPGDIPAEVARIEKLGAKIDTRMERWVVMRAPTGQRFCVVRVQRAGFPGNATAWD